MRFAVLLGLMWLVSGSCAVATETVTYSYDDLGRLSQTASSGSVNNGFATSVTYDAAGNRTGYTMSGSTNLTPLIDPDAIAYVAAMTVAPDAARKALINELITGLKTDGIWAKLSWLSLLAAHDAQAARLNVKAPAKSLIEASSPTFTVDRGYKGDGSSSYLYSPELLTASGEYTLNSASLGTYVNQTGTTSRRTILGASGSGVSSDFVASSTGWDAWLNTGSTGGVSTISSQKTGFFAAVRNSSSRVAVYSGVTGYLVSSASSTSTSVSATAPSFGRSGSYYSNDRSAAVFWGASLNSTDLSNFNARLLTYLTAIGAN
jgi:hypothetical protein